VGRREVKRGQKLEIIFNPFFSRLQRIAVYKGRRGRGREGLGIWPPFAFRGWEQQAQKRTRKQPAQARAEAGRRRRRAATRPPGPAIRRLAGASLTAAEAGGSSPARGSGGEDERLRRRGSEGVGGAGAGVREEAGAGAEGDREPPRRGDLRCAAGVRHGPRRGGQPPPVPRSHLSPLPFPSMFRVALFGLYCFTGGCVPAWLDWITEGWGVLGIGI